LRTGADIYPQFRVVTCDNDFDWSGSLLVRAGDSYVNFNNSSEERWGDYSGISRRHNSSDIEVWVSGCYGEDFDNGSTNVLSTWIAKISTAGNTQQAPIANFTADQTSISTGQGVFFLDLSTNNPNIWNWSFPGGTPNFSNNQNPIIVYNNPGTYDVTLTSTNAVGNDSETKSSYITVNSSVQIPVADFSANQTNINTGQAVTFTDLSFNSPTNWSWSFSGGSPSSSTSQNPTVTYNSPGTYNVTLTASNSAGNNSQTKTGYIIVNAVVSPPAASFVADQTVIVEGQFITFTDLSSNTPTTWTWSFPGSNSTTSTLQNPTVSYNTAGTYDVSLVVSNAGGSNVETKLDYIQVNAGLQVPSVDFQANNTSIPTGGVVQFTDFSSNSPTSWLWSFPGGQPNTSVEKNPIIIYPNDGIYDVSLIATNSVGSNSSTKDDYITVGVTSSENLKNGIEDFKIYPNPSSSKGRVYVEFEIKKSTELQFYLVDNLGHVIKHLLHHRVKSGVNQISFNNDMLASGNYKLIIQNKSNQILAHENLLIID